MKKKLTILVLLLIFLFFIYIVIYVCPKNYKINYNYNQKINIIEQYNKNNKEYIFTINNGKEEYKFVIDQKYKTNRKIISKVISNKKCITIKSKYFNDQTLCKNNNNYSTSFYSQKISLKEISKYKNITIYDYDNKTFFIWNYQNFLVINPEKNDTINLFSKDKYDLDLITKIGNYLFIADYNQKYYFNKFYLINIKNLKTKEVTLDKKIYFNSYILGTYKKNIYIYDAQECQEYKINPFKKLQEKVSNKILVDEKWQEISENKIQKKKYIFKNNENNYYYVKNNQLFYKTNYTNVKVTNLNVSGIIEADTTNCYFISNDVLYKVNMESGVKALLKFSEWKFNNKNIYIF